VPAASIARRGIAGIEPADVALAAERGWRLKLIALARRTSDGIEAAVTPAYVPRAHAFARPDGAQNVVRLVGEDSGPLEFFGLGAGGAASASSVVGDIVAAIEARARGAVPPRLAAVEALPAQPLRFAAFERGIPVLA
jgi:homoserine dehydrogenase